MKSPLRILAALFLAAFGPALAWAQSETVAAGSHLTLFVVVDGVPAPTVEWFKGGVKIADGVNSSGATWQHVIPSVTAADAGAYTAKATNSVGSATSDPITIIVGTAPSKPVIRILAKKPGDVTVEVPAGTRVITSPTTKK
jgi:Immunoglobulin I-set domain